MVEPETIGIGGGGGVIGALLAFLGFRQRLNRIESTLDEKIDSKTCAATHDGIIKLLESQTLLQKETRDDVKKLLTNSRG